MATIGPTEAAKRLGVTRARIHQLIASKELPATKWGIYWQMDEKDIEKMKAKRKARDV